MYQLSTNTKYRAKDHKKRRIQLWKLYIYNSIYWHILNCFGDISDERRRKNFITISLPMCKDTQIYVAYNTVTTVDVKRFLGQV